VSVDRNVKACHNISKIQGYYKTVITTQYSMQLTKVFSSQEYVMK